MKGSLSGVKLISLLFLLFFTPSKSNADSGIDFLNKCSVIQNNKTEKVWSKFRAGKEKFKASRKKEPINTTKKYNFRRGYCLGYIVASANALSIFLPGKFCPPKNLTRAELSLVVIEYLRENNSNISNLSANQLVSQALSKKFLCRK
jgi:hypothetical protein